jgi:hypothetical protein
MLFLNPFFWIAASALAGPILYHLLLRNKPKRMILPTLRFLPMASQESMAMHRFKNRFLLLLRLLILLLIVAAFTRPYFTRNAGEDDANATVDVGVVFALDTSMSMRVEDRWAMATQRIQTMLKTLPPDARLALFTFDRTPRVACPDTNDIHAIEMALNQARAGHGSTDLLAAIRTASDAAAQLNARKKRVFLVSDFQNGGFRQVTMDLALPNGVELVPVQITDTSPWNAAVLGMAEMPETRKNTRRVRVQLAGSGAGSAKGTLQIYADDKRLVSRTVQMDQNERHVEDFELVLDRAGAYALTARLKIDDALEEDNAYSFLLKAYGPLPLVVSSPRTQISLAVDSTDDRTTASGHNPYLQAAVSAFASKVAPEWIDPSKLSTHLASMQASGHMALLNSPESYAIQTQETLLDFAKQGGTLILFPGDGDPQVLEDLTDLHIEGWDEPGMEPDASSPAQTRRDYRLVSSGVSGGPFSLFDDAGAGLLGHPRAFRYLAVSLPEDNQDVSTLVHFDNARPFLVERKLGAGAIYLFTVPLDTKSSDLVLRASFSPFLFELMKHRTNQSQAKSSFVVGDLLRDEATETLSSDDVSAEPKVIPSESDGVLIDPAGQTIELSEQNQYFDAPGIYTLQRSQNERTLTVHTDPEESDLSLMDPQRLALLNQTGMEGGLDEDGLHLAALLEENPDLDARWRLWWYLLLAALALMLLESIVAARTSK